MTGSQAAALPVHRGMDVFSSYQDQYVGSVVRVIAGDLPPRPSPAAGPNPTGSEAPPGNPPMVHEEGQVVGATSRGGKRMLGEEMGPVPTIADGNTGPLRQSAAQQYATNVTHVLEGVAYIVVRPRRINLGPLTRPLYIPASAVRSISMERIVIGVQREQIPGEWHHRP